MPPLSDRFRIIEQIGEGAYGKVYKARDLVSGEIVALKHVHIFNPKAGLPLSFIRERKILSSIHHKNIVKLENIYRCDDGLFMVFEYCDFDLEALIKCDRDTGLTVNQVRTYFRQLLTAVDVLHQKNLCHRDLKPANIFINRDNTLKLGDFGLCKEITEDTKIRTMSVITPSYRAPEVLLGDKKYDQKTDIWSLGCILFELVTGYTLFKPRAPTDLAQLASIVNVLGSPSTENWPELSQLPGYQLLQRMNASSQSSLAELLDEAFTGEFASLRPLASAMLRFNPAERISASEALQDPFFEAMGEPEPLDAGDLHASDVLFASAVRGQIATRPLVVRPPRLVLA